MDKITDILKKIPSFSGLNESGLHDIKQIAVEKKYSKGGVVFIEGDEGKGFFVIVEGLIKVFKASADGKEQVLHFLGPGEPLGEVAVFAGWSFPANAMALSESVLLFFPRTAFVDLIGRNPSLAMNMLGVLSLRLRQFTIQVESLTLKEVPARLAAYLVHLSKKQKNPHTIMLDISKGSLAGLLGTIPETLSRIFSRMNEQQLIRVNGRKIGLIDLEGLKKLAEHGKTIG